MTDAGERGLIDAAQKDPATFADLYDRCFHVVDGDVVGRVRDRDAAEAAGFEVIRRET
jgi:hypothetical protein